jgi:hypothetical protein
MPKFRNTKHFHQTLHVEWCVCICLRASVAILETNRKLDFDLKWREMQNKMNFESGCDFEK